MAGKRQHYVPRLIQRGFLYDPSDESERTWLHRCGVVPRLVGIKDIGVEDWFYSRRSLDGALTLDDTITELERDLGPSIRRFRESAATSTIDAQEAARTVVHLVTRTAHLRQIISGTMTGMLREIEALFTDPARLGAMLGLTGAALPSLVSDAIRESAEELVSAGFPVALSERVIRFVLREFGDQYAEQMAAKLGPILPILFRQLTDKVRDTHNAVLSAPPENNGWLGALTRLNWTVEAGVDLILPDAVALACEDNGPLMPMLFTKTSDVRAVVMPVSPERVLVGRLGDGAPVDLGEFNSQAAASCEAFFIGAKPFNDGVLTARIGSAPTRVMEETISVAIREAEKMPQVEEMTPARAEPAVFSQHGFSYTVRLDDFGDENLAKEIGEVLGAVIDTLGRRIPLHELDGFTIAIDYHRALASLDRGDPNLPPVSSRALGYGQGIGNPVSVIRDGVRKEHLVISASLAEMWLSPDLKARSTGLHILVDLLAGVAHWTRYTSARDFNFTPDAMQRALHSAAGAAPGHYWSASQAAFVAPDQGAIYAALVIESLEFAKCRISEERGRLRDGSGIANVTRTALECVSAIIGHAADWLGHRDGLAEGQLFAGSDLPEQLKLVGLDRWIELFGRDLAACYELDGGLNLDVVTSLSRHVERLFWSFGIYCWPDADDVKCHVTDQFFVPPAV